MFGFSPFSSTAFADILGTPLVWIVINDNQNAEWRAVDDT